MKFAMTKLAAATTLAVAFSNVNAATIAGDTVIVSILNDTSGESMLIDTNVATADFRTGAVTSWSATADLTAAIDGFLGGSSASFWVAGYDVVGFDKWAFTTKVQVSSLAVGQFTTNVQAFSDIVSNGQFAAAIDNGTEEYLTNIAAGSAAHHINQNTNGYVADVVDTATFYSSQSGFFLGQIDTVYEDWHLNTASGELTYGVSAVPVPAAVWLFGSGLLGLVGVARRRNA